MRCQSHQVALILAGLARMMGLLGPLFCLSKVVRQGDHVVRLERSVRAILTQELHWDTEGELVEADTHRVDVLLKHTLYRPEQEDETDDPRLKQNYKLRKEEAIAIRDFYNADIRARRPRHICLNGHCKSRNEAIEKGVGAFKVPLRRGINPPDMSAWNSVHPLCCTILLLIALHNLLGRAELFMVGRDISSKHESDSDSEAGTRPKRQRKDEIHVMHIKEQQDIRRRDRRRVRRMRELLVLPSTFQTLIAWVTVAAGLMRIHFYLFTAGSLNATGKEGMCALMRFASLARSPAMRVISDFHNAMETDTDGFWELFVCFFGPQQSWPASLVQEVQCMMNYVCGSVYRRFQMVFREFPWKLALAVDTTLPMEQRRRVVADFLAANICCLDVGFSQRLRALIAKAGGTIDWFFEPHVQEWLYHVFAKGVICTTNLENAFAHIRRFVNMSWRAIHIASIAQHYMCGFLNRIHLAWIRSAYGEKACQQPPEYANHKTRPMWAQTKRSTVITGNDFVIISAGCCT